mgnify:FL=1|tara:strand:- start:673 stop:1554 length:882 start_codon:yes stop_codon:yes gene_type:complete
MSQENLKKVISNQVGKATDLANDAIAQVSSTVTDAKNLAENALNSVKDKFPFGDKKSVLSQLDFNISKNIKQADVVIQDEEKDWRLRLSLPKVFRDNAQNPSDLLAPLNKTNGLVFPFTPTVLVSQSANYQSIQPVHTNYPYYSYQNSQVDQMTITADFFVQNAAEARYWVACIHYLRSVTKMNFGVDEDAGQPPPVVRLNGYGDYVFNNVPVIVNSFQFDMPKDVDYISTAVGAVTPPATDFDTGTTPTGWAPATSIVTVAVTPQYSRTKQSQFSLNDFIKDGYIGKGGGFI